MLLSCNEYVLCDMIYFLCTNEKNSSGGWSYAKRETLADDLGLSKQGVLKMIEKLIERGFLIKHPDTKFLRTTEMWSEVYFQNGPSVNKVYSAGKQSLPEAGKQSLPNNNNINNNNNTIKENDKNFSELNFKVVPYPKWTIDQFKDSITEAREARKKDPKKPKFSTDMLRTFFAYWTEPDPQGVMKFAKQKTWRTAGRLAQWEVNQFNK